MAVTKFEDQNHLSDMDMEVKLLCRQRHWRVTNGHNSSPHSMALNPETMPVGWKSHLLIESKVQLDVRHSKKLPSSPKRLNDGFLSRSEGPNCVGDIQESAQTRPQPHIMVNREIFNQV